MTSNLDHVLDFIKLWHKMDLNAILAAMTEDCFYHNMPWSPLVGRAAIEEGLASFIRGAKSIEWRVLHAAETKDGIVLTERLDRFLMNDRWIEIPVMGMFELRGSHIARWRDYFDAAGFEAAMAVPQ